MPVFKNNPGILGDDDLVKGFVVRRETLDLLLECLRENAAAACNRHLLLLGPRGIGKTTLVRRCAAEVRTDEAYGAKWLPVVFGEESYQVTSAGEFWLEALIRLGDEIRTEAWRQSVEELRGESKDARLRERALAQLLDYADGQGKRLLLVVENLHMLCEQIGDRAAWELRHTLLNEPRIMLMGTATSRFGAIADQGQAWFDLFGPIELKPLDLEEGRTLWRAVAEEELPPGPARAIRILTGGNPRLVTVMAGFAAKHSFRELMLQLVQLIDAHTEYFKGHLDVLPTKERKVFVGLLEHWDPVSASELARISRMKVNEVSALLNRLVGRGAVEMAGSNPRKKLYQVSERLYNIYYLMRRRGEPADRVRAAVSFLVTFYEGEGLAGVIGDVAREAAGLPKGEAGDHYIALGELLKRAPKKILLPTALRFPIAVFARLDWSSLVGSVALESWELEMPRQLANEYPDASLPWFALSGALWRVGRHEEALEAVERALAIESTFAPGWAHRGTILRECGRPEAAIASFRRAVELDPTNSKLWLSLGESVSKLGLPEEVEAVWTEALRLHPELADYAVYLLRVRERMGVAPAKLMREAEDWLGKANRSALSLVAMADFAFSLCAPEIGRQWAQEAYAKAPNGSTYVVLCAVYLAKRNWASALAVCGPWLDSYDASPKETDLLLAFLAVLVRAEQGTAALAALQRSSANSKLEPLTIGLRMYLGEEPVVAKELLEIGKDIAAKIAGLSRPPDRQLAASTS
ncbi:MAG: tetratricopeptide repeat protein [Acidobacteria bacterium]|nr:tetratricopeptide repeat protein [Acidobacteriota bacterium]